MKNTFTSPADFWQERDFGAKISATFDFIGVHWRPLFKCLVYFVLPCALLLGIGLGLITNSMFNFMSGSLAAKRGGVPLVSPASPFGMFSFGGMALGFVGGILSFLLLTGTVFGYLRARLRLPAAEPITPTVVWAELRNRLGRMVLVFGLVAVAYVAVCFGFLLLVGLSARAGGGPAIGGMVLSFFLLMVLGAYLGVALSLFFPVLWLEDLSIFATLGRCFHLIRGHWWATFGLLMVVAIIQSMLTFVFVIPQYAVMVGKMMQVPELDSDVLGLVTQCFYAVGIMFTYAVPLLAITFQYFNLAEQQEGYGLRLLMDQLGQPQGASVAQSDHYQPDDDGEY